MGRIKNKYKCLLELSTDLIGGKWKMTILWHLMDGEKRFTELKKYIPKITNKILTEQLRELEEAKIISRKVYPTIPPKVEYSMTDHGISLIPILIQLCDWATEYALGKNIEIC